MDSLLTVREILQRPLFADACVVAGENGLHRRVRWVHVLEITNIEAFVHGEEMILTTGIPFKSDSISFVSYLERLIQFNVSCLCIELSKDLESVPEAMIEAANEHQFPIIVFPRVVRFVDITQDIHSLIINQHHQILKDLERISREFHRLTLTSQGISNVLRLLHTSTKSQVIYLPMQGQPNFIPLPAAQEQSRLTAYLTEKLTAEAVESQNDVPCLWDYDGTTLLSQSVGALGTIWAHIVLVLNHKPQEKDFLILDSASLSIAQDLLRKRYMEERRLYTENLWIDDLLHARLKDEEQIKSFIGLDYKQLNESPTQVCLIEFDQTLEQKSNVEEEREESIGIHLSLVLRALFEEHSFLPLMTLKNNALVVVAIDQKSNSSKPLKSTKKTNLSMKNRLHQVFDTLQSLNEDKKIGNNRLLIGVGRSFKNLMNAHLSYQEAIQSISLYPCFEQNILFFEELGVFQLLFHVDDKSVLESFVTRYLGPLIEHDQTKGSKLTQTLKVYLDNDGSKQLAAKKLFVVRQSLYYRLEQIEELLGADYMNPEKRLALQVALRAYQMLRPEE